MAKKKSSKKWYLVRNKSDSRGWIAYQLTEAKIKLLRPEYKYKGPFKTLLDCMFHTH
jgi:hypothetical protein